MYSQYVRVGVVVDPDSTLRNTWVMSYLGEEWLIDAGGGNQRPLQGTIAERLPVRRRAHTTPPEPACDPLDVEDLALTLGTTTAELEANQLRDPSFPEPLVRFRGGKVCFWSLEDAERWRSHHGS